MNKKFITLSTVKQESSTRIPSYESTKQSIQLPTISLALSTEKRRKCCFLKKIIVYDKQMSV